MPGRGRQALPLSGGGDRPRGPRRSGEPRGRLPALPPRLRRPAPDPGHLPGPPRAGGAGRRPGGRALGALAAPHSRLNPFARGWLPRCGRSNVGHHPILRTLSLAAALAGRLLPAARAETVRITLADALAMAERQSPDLAAARAQAQAADQRAEAARRAGWPRLDLSVGGSYTDIPSAAFAHKLDSGEFKAGDFALSRLNDPAGIFHLGTTLAVEAPLDAFGKVRAGARQASAGAKSAG